MATYVDDLLSIVRAYDRVQSQMGPALAPAFDAVNARKRAADHDFLVTDLKQLIHESRDGVERISKIVHDLKDFSRAGNNDWQWTDLHQGLESTLGMAWNELKYKAEVTRGFGELPAVYCLSSQINQVVLNLLVNAAHAIPQRGKISVRTGTDGATVWIKEDSSVNVYLNGLGLGSIAAAMYLIQKADFDPSHIHIFEQKGDHDLVGGSCDASHQTVNGEPAYFMQGSRMFEDKVYPCTKELWSIIPYNDDESCLQDHQKNREECRVDTVVRLLHEDGKKDTGYQLGPNTAEKLNMAKLLATPEFLIPDGAKITDMFGEAFFTSNYWYMWRALFAFQPWHSAVEMKRYMRLFFHEMPNMNTMVALERTRYTNFHSFVLPALRFMQDKGVNVHYNCRIADVDFKMNAGSEERWIERLHLETESGTPLPAIEVRDTDRPVDKPAITSQNLGGAWTLWKKIAAKQPDLGRPDQFLRDTSLSKMMTFTVTLRGGLFQRKFEWLVERQMGRQSPLPLPASPWILHLHTYRQPLFPDQLPGPAVVPAGSKNFAFLGQFVEIPDGIVFTTEYSVLGAMQAVKQFVEPSLVVPSMYFGQHHPLTAIAVAVARALAR